ncbi:dermonecrotic toxin domain-containing protein [Pseudomonas sp. TE24901]
MTTALANASNRVNPAPTVAPGTVQTRHSAHAPNSAREKLRADMVKELNSGRMSPDVHSMVEGVLFPGQKGLPNVQVKTLAVAKEGLLIERIPHDSSGVNIVLYLPENQGHPFHLFNDTREMNSGLKTLARDPERFGVNDKNAMAGRDADTDVSREPVDNRYQLTAPRKKRETSETVSGKVNESPANAPSTGGGVDEAAQTLLDLAEQMDKEYPTPQKVVAERVRKEIKDFTTINGPQVLDIDPDRVFIQHFSEEDPEYEKLGFKPKGYVIGDHKPTSQPKSLTQAIADNDPWSDDRVSGGQTVIFTADPANPKYDPANKLELDPGLLPAIARNRDMAKLYGKAQQEFWQKNMGNMQALHEKNYALRAGIEAAEGTLSKEGLAMVVEAADFNTPGQADSKHVARSLLQIGDYRSSDIVVLKHKDTGRVVVYMPADGQSFFEFKDDVAMRKWVFEVAKSEEGRNALEKHFTKYYLRDGPFKDGVSTLLKKMVADEKKYFPTVVMYGQASARIEGNLFENLTKLQAWDAISDGDEVIKSNRKLLLEKIAKLAGAVGTIFPPAVFLTAPTQIVIAAWQANNGHTAAERGGAVANMGYAAGDLALSLLPTTWITKLLKPVVKQGSRLVKGFAKRRGSYSLASSPPSTEVPKGTAGSYKTFSGARDPIPEKPPARPNNNGRRKPLDEPESKARDKTENVPSDKVSTHENKASVTPAEITAANGTPIAIKKTMQDLRKIDDGVFVFTDYTKGGQRRLNILAHGKKLGTHGADTKNAAITLHQKLVENGIDLESYDRFRVLACSSGSKGVDSFITHFHGIVKKPVKGYDGVVTTSMTPEVIQREFDKARNIYTDPSKANQGVVENFAQNKKFTQQKETSFNPFNGNFKYWLFRYKPITVGG